MVLYLCLQCREIRCCICACSAGKLVSKVLRNNNNNNNDYNYNHKISKCCRVVKPRSGELRTQKLKSHLVRTQSLNVVPLKPGVGQYIATHATLTARDFFLSCLFLHFRSIHLHFFQNLSRFFPVLAVANTWFLCRPAE